MIPFSVVQPGTRKCITAEFIILLFYNFFFAYRIVTSYLGNNKLQIIQRLFHLPTPIMSCILRALFIPRSSTPSKAFWNCLFSLYSLILLQEFTGRRTAKFKDAEPRHQIKSIHSSLLQDLCSLPWAMVFAMCLNVTVTLTQISCVSWGQSF